MKYSSTKTNEFVLAVGFGVDYKLNNAVVVRIASLDYSRSWTDDLNWISYHKGVQFTSGLVLRMGTW